MKKNPDLSALLEEVKLLRRGQEVEAALEDLRAQSMAMHKREELIQVVRILDKALSGLGIEIDVPQIQTDFANPENGFNVWLARKGQDYLEKFHIPFIKHPIFKKLWTAVQKGTEFYTESYSKTEKNEIFKILFENSDYSAVSEEQQNFVYSTQGLIRVSVLSKNSILVFQRFSLKEFSKEEEEIFKRFGKVFEQAYVRFLDLQKAEAQTREAQIALAVERVRARALAMFKSEEIIEVVAKLKDEVMSLDIPDVIAATIFLNQDDDQVRMWDLSSVEKVNDGFQLPFDITFKLKKSDPLLYVKRVWENPEDYFVEKQEEKDFERYVEWLRENNKVEVAGKIEAYIKQTDLKLLNHVVKKLKNGKIAIDLLNPPSAEMESILTKMGAAFDLAYTRFLDLQKAEAQAREAQIEVALERVRSRSMAMHNSNELRDVVNTLHNELRSLNVNFHVAIIQLLMGDPKDLYLWAGTSDGLYDELVYWPYVDIRVRNEIYQVQLSKTPIEIVLTHAETIEFFEEYFNVKGTPQERKAATAAVELIDIMGFYQANTGIFLMRYSEGSYSEDEKIIAERFSKVFEQTYTRFLDLQKAEVQAREAQIEVALERVRSRSIAMHKSVESQEVIEIVFDQILKLGVMADSANFLIFNQENKDLFCWLAAPKQKIRRSWNVPYTDIYPTGALQMEIEKGNDSFMASCSFEQKNEWFKWAFEYSDFKYFPDDRKEFILKSKCWTPSYAWLKYTGIQLTSFSRESFTENENEILKRFAKVFEQTYTRFLDLQKAEAQAREAQIEVALEKVRSASMAMHKSDDLLLT